MAPSAKGQGQQGYRPMIATATDKGYSTLRLRFFDQEAVIHSDSDRYTTIFSQLYRRFRVGYSSSAPASLLEFHIFSHPEDVTAKPSITLNGEVFPVHDDDPRSPEQYVHDTIHQAIIDRVQSHLIVHAGVVSWKGRGIILAGNAYHGKTTLVLELVRRGFKFLSDDRAALGWRDRLVHPFPRSLRICPDTFELIGLPQLSRKAPVTLGKHFLDIEDIVPGSIGGPAAISHIVILRDPADDRPDEDPRRGQNLLICVPRLDQALIHAASQVEGVIAASSDALEVFPVLVLRTTDRERTLDGIRTLCRARKTRILAVGYHPIRRPTFEGPAYLQAATGSQAVMELLKRMRGGVDSLLGRHQPGNTPTRLFMRLAGVIDGASAHYLALGPLADMADLVCGLVGA